MKTTLTKRPLVCLLIVTTAFLLPITIDEAISGQSSKWWNSDWRSYIPVNITEVLGIDRFDQPVDVHMTFDEGKCRDPRREVRVLLFNGNDWIEISSQVYNTSYRGNYAISCNVVFMADCPAHNTVTYYVYYNNRFATYPVYDGLRLYEEAAGDTYTVNATKEGTEKKYFRIFWKKSVDLCCDGVQLAWPGGKADWEFSQMVFSSLWEDDKENYWFSSDVNSALKVLNIGPLFVDLRIELPVASDLWGTVFNSNVSVSYTIRVYYRRDLNPLLRFQASFSYKEDAVTKSPWFLTLKLANGTIDDSYEVYEHTTFKDIDGTISKVPAENVTGGAIWSEVSPVGWWSFNGSRPESDGKPSANIGVIPVGAEGTNPAYDYKVHFNSQLEEKDNEAWFFLGNITGGLKGEIIETVGFINTYSLGENAIPAMTETSERLRNPLEYNLGSTVTKPIVKREDFAVRPYQDISELSVFSDGEVITMNLTLNGPIPEVGWQHLNIYIAFDTLEGGNYWFPDDIDVKYPDEYPYAWEYCLIISNVEHIRLFNVNLTDLGSINITVTTMYDSIINIAIPLQRIGDPSTISIGVVTTEDAGPVKDALGPGAVEIVGGIQVVTVTSELLHFPTEVNSSTNTTDIKPFGMGIGEACWDLIEVWHSMNSTHFIVYTTFSNIAGVDWEEWRLSIAIDVDHKPESGEYWIRGFNDSRIDPAVNTTYWEYCCLVDSPSDIQLYSRTSNTSITEGMRASLFGDLLVVSIPLSDVPGLVTPTLTVVCGSEEGNTACNFAGAYVYDFEETPPGAYMITSHNKLMAEDREAPIILDVIPAMRGQEIAEDVVVSVNATVVDDPGGSGIERVVLQYSTDGGVGWEAINMTKIEDDVYASSIPQFRVGMKVMYAINATDAKGNYVISTRYWYKTVAVPQTLVWFGLGLAVGSVIALFAAMTIGYARRKTYQ